MWQLKKTVVLFVILAVGLATIWAAPADKKCKCKGKVISPSEQTSLLSHMVEMLSKLIRHQKEHICLTSNGSELYDISVCNSTGSEEEETCQSPVVNTTKVMINEDVSLAKPTNPTEGYVTLSSVETETMNPVQKFPKEDPTITRQTPNGQDGSFALNEDIFEPSENVTTFRYEEDVTKSKLSSYDQKITSFSKDVSEPDEENVTLDPVDNLTGHPNNKEETATGKNEDQTSAFAFNKSTFKLTEDDVTELPDHEEAVTIIDSGLEEPNLNENTTPQLHDNKDKIASNKNSFKSFEDPITEIPDYVGAIAIIDPDSDGSITPTSNEDTYNDKIALKKNTSETTEDYHTSRPEVILNSKEYVTEDSQDKKIVNEDLSEPIEVITWRPEDNAGINKNHSSEEYSTTSIYSDKIVSDIEDPIYKKAASVSEPFSPKKDVTVNIHSNDDEITTPGYFILNENTFKPIDEYVTIRSEADVYNDEEEPQNYEDRTRVPFAWRESTSQPSQSYLTTEYTNYEEASTPNEDPIILNPTENIHLQSDRTLIKDYVTLKPEVGVAITDNPNFEEAKTFSYLNENVSGTEDSMDNSAKIDIFNESTSESTEEYTLKPETITENPIYEEETGTAIYSTEAATVIQSHSDESPLVFSENTGEGFITLRPEDDQIINDYPNSGLEKNNLEGNREDSTRKILLNPQEGVTETVEDRSTTVLTILSDKTNGNSKNSSKFITNEESETKPEGFEYFTLPSVEQSVPNSDSKIFESGLFRTTTRNPPLQSASPSEGSGDDNIVKGKPYIKK